MNSSNYDRFKPQSDGPEGQWEDQTNQWEGQAQWGGPDIPPWDTSEPRRAENTIPPVIPFRPLTVGDLFSGTFAAIGLNPSVMFTISVATMAVIGLFAGLLAAWVGPPMATDLSVTVAGGAYEDSLVAGPLSAWQMLSENVVSLLTAGATLLVTGALVLVVTSEVVGRKLDLANTFAALRPVIWKLLGTALLVWLILFGVMFGAILLAVLGGVLLSQIGFDIGFLVLLGVLTVFGLIAVVMWLGVRFYYATVVAVVESASPVQALKRSWALTQKAFWRTLGRGILIGLVVGVATGILGAVVVALTMLLGTVIPTGLLLFLSAFISMVIAGVVMPISASYISLMYVDQRMRTEGIAPSLEAAWHETLRSQPGY